ncbi:MAG: hypothetical protein ACE5HB_03255 [Terriglobia bacterium]
MRFRFLLVFFVLGWLGISALARELAGERRVFAVSVLDRDGNPVHGLTAENFRGKGARIVSGVEKRNAGNGRWEKSNRAPANVL